VENYFTPASVAVVGASSNPAKGGYVIVDNLKRLGFKGRILPVNPEYEEILGLPCYPNFDSIPGKVDLAIIIVPRDKVEAIIMEGKGRDVKNYIICTAGFSDGGEEGQILERRLIDLAQQYDLSFMGPNSIGTINTENHLATSITFLNPLSEGHVSIIGQSGVFSSGLARFLSEGDGPGLSRVACLGNKAVLDEVDILNYLGQEEKTRVIGLYLEGVKRGKDFIQSVSKISRQKPVIALKSGNSREAAAAISSHTGSLAISETVFKGIASQSGLCLVNDLEQLLDTLKTFEIAPLPAGNGLGVVSISGMGCVLSADYAAENGLIIPVLSENAQKKIAAVAPSWARLRNPADIWAVIEQHGPAKAFAEITSALVGEDDINSIILIFVLIKEAEFNYYEVFEPILANHPQKTFLAVNFGGTSDQISSWRNDFKRLGVPTFPDLNRAIKALRSAVWYGEYLNKMNQV